MTFDLVCPRRRRQDRGRNEPAWTVYHLNMALHILNVECLVAICMIGTLYIVFIPCDFSLLGSEIGAPSRRQSLMLLVRKS